MSIALRMFFTVLCFILGLVCLVFAVVGIVKAVAMLTVVCLMIAAGFGFFVYKDIKFYLSNNTTTNK